MMDGVDEPTTQLAILEPEPVVLMIQIDRGLWDLLGPRARRILEREMPLWVDRFIAASVHYGDTNADVLGPAGQFADIWRKIGPLKRALWEGQTLTREGVDEILRDLIGHSFLTLEMMSRAKDT